MYLVQNLNHAQSTYSTHRGLLHGICYLRALSAGAGDFCKRV